MIRNLLTASSQYLIQPYLTLDIFGDNSCKALYALEDNALDESGNYNGTATSMVYSSGINGRGGDFRTSAPTFIIPNSVLTGLTSLTVTAWVNMANINSDSTPISSSSVTPQYFITPIRVLNGYVFGQFGLGGTGAISTPQTSLAILADTWYMITFVFNSDKTIQMSLNNGALTAKTAASPYSLSQIVNNLLLFNSGGADYATGLIDQVRIFNRPLTVDEITTLYTQGA